MVQIHWFTLVKSNTNLKTKELKITLNADSFLNFHERLNLFTKNFCKKQSKVSPQ